ncbi:Uncharacterized phage-associated protein [Microbacterium sp. cf046]|nr:Uncharacterized phage-associated protein [Microbacterium sp. cf046]
MTATSAAAIAAKVLQRAHASGVPVSNMKLQKLVTLVQSLSVYATGNEAFREDVQAWKNGPAIKPLYGSYKRFGSDSISEVVPSRHSQDPVPPAIEQMIDEVWNVAGELSASQLWTLSHANGPWEEYYSRNERDTVIPNDRLGQAWVDYLSCAMSMNDAPPKREPQVVGRGQLGYESEDLHAYARATFTPSRMRRSA